MAETCFLKKIEKAGTLGHGMAAHRTGLGHNPEEPLHYIFRACAVAWIPLKQKIEIRMNPQFEPRILAESFDPRAIVRYEPSGSDVG